MNREQLLQDAFVIARLGHRMNDGSDLGLRCAWNAFRCAGVMLESFLAYSEQPEHKTACPVFGRDCSSCEVNDE